MAGILNKIKALMGSSNAQLLEEYRSLEKEEGRTGGVDDYNWEHYHIHYQWEHNEISKLHSFLVTDKPYTFDKKTKKLIHPENSIKPLHPNWITLYETINQLGVKSCLEVGCGNGMHIHNLNLLNSKLETYGFDRGVGQLELLKKQYPSLASKVKLHDATFPFDAVAPKVDAVYTQAVIMHIRNKNDYLKVLQNCFRAANSYVLLIENLNTHNFVKDIERLHQNGKLGWDDLFLYRQPESLNQSLLLYSKRRIDIPNVILQNR